MSASHSTTEDPGTHETDRPGSAEHSGGHPHPPMPAVHDEAADTPAWVPVSGVVLLVVMVLAVMMRAALAPPTPEPGAATTDEAYGAEGAAPAPAEPAAQ